MTVKDEVGVEIVGLKAHDYTVELKVASTDGKEIRVITLEDEIKAEVEGFKPRSSRELLFGVELKAASTEIKEIGGITLKDRIGVEFVGFKALEN